MLNADNVKLELIMAPSEHNFAKHIYRVGQFK